MPDRVCGICNKSRLLAWTTAQMRAISATVSRVWPSTESRTGLQALCDIGVTKLAIDTSGDASHSPQPTYGPACTRTNNASWLPSPMSNTSGIDK